MSLPPGALDAIAVSIGSVGGALARYQVGKVATEYISKDPKKFGHLTGWHTAGINILGSFVLGVVAGSPTKQSTSVGITARQKLMVGVGFCGSFTTFSTFSVDLVTMSNEGRFLRAFSYCAINNVGGFAAAASGMILVRKIMSH